MKKLLIALLIFNSWYYHALPTEARFSTKFGDQVKVEIDKRRLDWDDFESSRSELTPFSKYSYASAGIFFFLGGLAYVDPETKSEFTTDFGLMALSLSLLGGSAGYIYEYMFGKNAISDHKPEFIKRLSELDEYILESNRKMDGSKISSQERERVEKYMNVLRTEWKQKLDVCKKINC